MSVKDLEGASSTECKKVTVTMHGGGHCKYCSQNHGSGTARPPYLIAQCRSAFERAGLTPKNLDLVAKSSDTKVVSFINQPLKIKS